MLIHSDTPPLVHGVLLGLDVAQLLLELATLGHRALLASALASVDLQEGVDAAADVAATLDLDLTRWSVAEQILHLLAIR